MAPGRAESDFGLQGWIDTLGLKQIFLIFSVEQPTITSFRLIWFEQKKLENQNFTFRPQGRPNSDWIKSPKGSDMSE